MKFALKKFELKLGLSTLCWVLSQTIMPTQALAQTFSPLIYRVGPDETLSQILDQLGVCPIYGKNNKLNQTIALNSSSIRKNGHFILPQSLIKLPAEKLNKDPDYQILSSGEVLLLNARPASKCDPRKIKRIASEGPLFIEREKNIQDRPASAASEIDQVSDELAQSSFNVGAGADYFRIEGVDSSSNGRLVILSNISTSFKFGWDFEWDTKTIFSFSTGIQRFSLQPLGDGQSLTEDSGTRGSFSFTYKRILTSRFLLGAGLNLSDELFFYAKTPTVLSLDKVTVISPIILGRYTLLEKKNALVGVLGEAGILLPGEAANYKLKTGVHAQGGLFLRHLINQLEFKGIEGQIFYLLDKQDTSVTTRKSWDLGFKLLYFWRPGE